MSDFMILFMVSIKFLSNKKIANYSIWRFMLRKNQIRDYSKFYSTFLLQVGRDQKFQSICDPFYWASCTGGPRNGLEFRKQTSKLRSLTVSDLLHTHGRFCSDFGEGTWKWNSVIMAIEIRRLAELCSLPFCRILDSMRKKTNDIYMVSIVSDDLFSIV